MGANTYRLMSELASGGEPGTDALADLSEIVFSTTLKDDFVAEYTAGRPGRR